MKEYQYVVRTISADDGSLQHLLNEMGATGFRLVGFATTRVKNTSPHGPKDTVILERPVEGGSEDSGLTPAP